MTRKIWKVFVSLALVAILLLIAAEFGVRWMIGEQLKKDFAQSGQSQEEPTISFGPTPVLLSQITGKVASIDIHTPSSVAIADGQNGAPSVTGNPAADIAIKDLDISDHNNPIAGHLDVDTTLAEDYLLAQAQSSMVEQAPKKDDMTSQLISGLVKITGLDATPADQSVHVEFTGGAASLALKPTTENGQVKFTAQSASLLGVDLPKSVTDSITKALEKQTSEATSNLNVDSITVEESAVRVHVSGDNVPLKDMSQG